MNPRKIYFQNLNALRFIAVSMVIIHHVEQLKSTFKIPNYWESNTIFLIGKLGVVLFFVLSGFLISYLLFEEESVTKTISVKNFYIRRVLRIWPLYFFIIFISFFILPNFDFFNLPGYEKDALWSNLLFKISLYLFFLPNLAMLICGVVPYYSVITWSIGAEEQFYLIWPLLLKKNKNKWILLSGIIFLYLFVKFILIYLGSINQIFATLNSFWATIPIDCMAIGGIFALIIYEKSEHTDLIKKVLFNSIFQWIILITTVVSLLFGLNIPYVNYEFYSVLFGIIICNFAANREVVFSLENKVTVYLGKISYGLYIFHPIAIIISIQIFIRLNFNNYIFYLNVFIITIILATLSYEFLEKRFINKKINFSNIISGDNVTNH